MSIDLGYGAGRHLANLAAVEAVWGRSDEALEHAEGALAIGQRSGFTLLTDSAEFTLGFVDLAAGRLDEARERLLALTALDRPSADFVVALKRGPGSGRDRGPRGTPGSGRRALEPVPAVGDIRPYRRRPRAPGALRGAARRTSARGGVSRGARAGAGAPSLPAGPDRAPLR
jgi:hypothetical protein